MSARCAACEEPIDRGEKFVLTGTEVFHRRCAAGIRRSVRTRLELRLIDLERDIATARAEIMELKRQTTDERDRTRDAVRTRLVIEDDLRVARAARDAALRDSAYWRERGESLATELARIRGELETARAAARPPPPVTTAETAPAKDDRDATEIRFSLLELDKP